MTTLSNEFYHPCCVLLDEGEGGMKTTEFLMYEHKLILRALDVLDEMALAIEENIGVEHRDIEAILHFLRWFADGQHQAKEERVLFPALKAAAASQQRSVEHMLLEHDQERALIEDMENKLRVAKLSEFVLCANKLSSVLRNHIYKEDHILFETVDVVLSAREDEAVVEELSAFGSVSEDTLLREITNLRRLEWKYLGRMRYQKRGIHHGANQANPVSS